MLLTMATLQSRGALFRSTCFNNQQHGNFSRSFIPSVGKLNSKKFAKVYTSKIVGGKEPQKIGLGKIQLISSAVSNDGIPRRLSKVEVLPGGDVLFHYENVSAQSRTEGEETDPSVLNFICKSSKRSSICLPDSKLLTEVLGDLEQNNRKEDRVKEKALKKKKLYFDPLAEWLESRPKPRVASPLKRPSISKQQNKKQVVSVSELLEVQAQLKNQLSTRDSVSVERTATLWRSSGPAAFRTGMEMQVAVLERMYFRQQKSSIMRFTNAVDKIARLSTFSQPAMSAVCAATPSSFQPVPESSDKTFIEKIDEKVKWEPPRSRYSQLNFVVVVLAVLGVFQLISAPNAASTSTTTSAVKYAYITARAAIGVALLWVSFLTHRLRAAALGLFEHAEIVSLTEMESISRLKLIHQRFFRHVALVVLFFVAIPTGGARALKQVFV